MGTSKGLAEKVVGVVLQPRGPLRVGRSPEIRSGDNLGSFTNGEHGYRLVAAHVIAGRPQKADVLGPSLIANRGHIIDVLGMADRVLRVKHERAGFARALSQMLQAQAHQEHRLDGSTYASHSMNVTSRIFGFGVQDLVAAKTGVLHDSVEGDALGLAIATGMLREGDDPSDKNLVKDLALAGLADSHGFVLSRAVRAISSPDFRAEVERRIPHGTREEKRILRNQLYRNFIVTSVIHDAYALLAKCADTCENGSTLDGLDREAQIRRCEKYLLTVEDLLAKAIRESESNIIMPHKDAVLGELLELSTALKERLAKLRSER